MIPKRSSPTFVLPRIISDTPQCLFSRIDHGYYSSSKVPGSCLDRGLTARHLIHTADMSTFEDISPPRGWLTESNTNHTAVTHLISSAMLLRLVWTLRHG